MKKIVARVLGWGQLFVMGLSQALTAHGIPHDVKGWLPILGSACVAVSIHHASNTDGSR